MACATIRGAFLSLLYISVIERGLRNSVKGCLLLLSALLSAGCSTHRNTAVTRFYHSTVTRFNVYYNGITAYKEGYEAQEKAVKDNYLEILDVFPLSDENARNAGASNFDRAIEKAQKSVTLHSIKAKPKKKSGKLSDRQKAWYEKNEYNPYLWHAWMLLGDAQKQKGDFLEAAGVYSYICRLFKDQPDVVAEARMKMAQCYSELEWIYEADEVFMRLSADSVPHQLRGELAAIKSAHMLKQKRYGESLSMLAQAIPGQRMSRTQKIRENYILGQLYKVQGNNEAAFRSFQKVINMNPPYRIEFNARIQQTETTPISEAARMERKLMRMAKDPKNKDYLDQVYYAMGNIFLALGDTAKAFERYETGLKEGKERTPERGVLLLHMATLYWDKGMYADASRCYSEVVGLIDQENPKYDEVMTRSAALEELVGYTTQIELQDSLQRLATMTDTVALYKIIDGVIERLLAEEAEAERLAREAERQADMNADLLSQTTVASNDGSWYFYNPALTRQGAQQFKSIWGNRKLEDNWRRADKSASLSDFSDGNDAVSDGAAGGDLAAAADSTAAAGTEGTAEMLSDDPHTREYYIQQIPFSDEQKAESDVILADALFHAGVIYKDELTEYGLAEKVLVRNEEDFPELEYADDALYNLYLMYSLWGKPEMADRCRESLMERYPGSDFTLIVSDPEFEENVRFGKHREDSLYQAAYSYYRNGMYDALKESCRISAEKYPTGAHRARFMFLEASTYLADGDIQGFLTILKSLVEKYPESEIASLADMITQEVRSGRVLQSASFGSIWDRRNGLGDSEEVEDSVRPKFNPDRYQPYIVVMAYPEDSLNENQLLFETARYNFSRYMVRNFDLDFRHEQGIGMLVVSEFLNFDEAYLYRKRLYSEGNIASVMRGMNILIITEENLQILLKYYSFNEYSEFFDENYLNIPEVDIDGFTIDEEPGFEDDYTE